MGTLVETMSKELIRLREETGMSQTAFAEAMQVSPQTVLHYEQGKRTPALEYIENAAMLAHRRPSDVFRAAEVKMRGSGCAYGSVKPVKVYKLGEALAIEDDNGGISHYTAAVAPADVLPLYRGMPDMDEALAIRYASIVISRESGKINDTSAISMMAKTVLAAATLFILTAPQHLRQSSLTWDATSYSCDANGIRMLLREPLSVLEEKFDHLMAWDPKNPAIGRWQAFTAGTDEWKGLAVAKASECMGEAVLHKSIYLPIQADKEEGQSVFEAMVAANGFSVEGQSSEPMEPKALDAPACEPSEEEIYWNQREKPKPVIVSKADMVEAPTAFIVDIPCLGARYLVAKQKNGAIAVGRLEPNGLPWLPHNEEEVLRRVEVPLRRFELTEEVALKVARRVSELETGKEPVACSSCWNGILEEGKPM